MSRFVSKYVVCPFYRRHDNNRICCEGTTDDNTINVVFGDSKKLKEHTVTYCEDISNYKRCQVCKMLSEKYPNT